MPLLPAVERYSAGCGHADGTARRRKDHHRLGEMPGGSRVRFAGFAGRGALSVTDHALVSQVFLQKFSTPPAQLWAVAVGAHRQAEECARLNAPEALAEWAEANRPVMANSVGVRSADNATGAASRSASFRPLVSRRAYLGRGLDHFQ